ncbi:hypothetical protein E4U41_007139 [Claviceps citrina]|nr:hypothetical protein E4U41_007139 [Claviceps citrina]
MAMGSTSMHGSSDALSEGRRIYLGNLLYTVGSPEIEEALRAHDLDDFEAVHISVDAVSGRNPGYCFVDFAKREDAERALESLDASIGGRTLKVGPCKPKQPRTSASGTGAARWGNDHRSPSSQRASSSSFVDESAAEDFGKRVYVGGLGPSVDQAVDAAEVTELFAGFTLGKIGNRIKPHDSTTALPGNHHYCFVELGTKEEAQSAIETLNGKATESGPLKVSAAKPPPAYKQREQRSGSYHNNSSNNNRFLDRSRRGPGNQDGGPNHHQGEVSPAGSRSMASGNWRRKGD